MNWFEISLMASLIMLSLSIVIVFIRVVIGPTLPDRVIAFDLIGTILIGMIAIYSIVTGVEAYMDAAIILSLVMFLGSVAFAYFLQKDHKS